MACYARNLERRRARSILSNSVSGTKQPSVNGVEWSASIFPFSFSPLLTSLLDGRGEFIHIHRVHVLIALSFLSSRYLPKYFEKDIQSGAPTLTQAGRVALEAELKYEDEVADAGEHHDNADGG